MKATDEIAIIERFAKVANDPIVQGAGPGDIIGIASNEDRWNRVACGNQLSVELDSSHQRHMNVSDQTGGCIEMRRREKIGCQWKDLYGVAERSHEPSHGFANEDVILYDRDQ
jgi:hypothetical protein